MSTATNDIDQRRRWHLLADRQALVTTCADALLALANRRIAEHGRFTIVLAGGGTPAPIYRRLVNADTDWRRWFVYFGDERCLPRGHAERNDRMAELCWLGQVPIPQEQIHAIPAELGPAEGAAAYAHTLEGAGRFDLVLLGLGEDGHTASLFKTEPAGGAAAIPVFDAPKPPPQRISLSATRLSDADRVWFLVSGADKREALGCWQRGQPLPAATIRPSAGVDIYTDLRPD